MLITPAENRIIQKFPTNFTSEQLAEAFRIFEEIVNNLDDGGVRELLGGYELDTEKLYNVMLEEILQALYGKKNNINAKIGYLDNVAKQIEETLCIENLTYFIMSKIPSFMLNWHHLEWGDIVQRYDKFNVIAARDHGKSYYFSNVYLVWKMYRYQPFISPQISRFDLSMSKLGYLFSFSQQQATDLLEILKGTIEENDEIREKLLPKSTSEGWAKTEITCKNGTRLRTKGFGSAVRGAHPGYIAVDDGLKDNVIYSSVQRKKSIEYFQAVIMNMIVPGGQVGVVGTPFHNADLYGDLKSKRGWHCREYPAIFPDGTVLWRERWGLDELLEKRETQGNLIFSRENLCKPVTNESSLFPLEIIQRSYLGMDDYVFTNSRDGYKLKFNTVVTSCDFSISASVGADYTVITTTGVDENDNIWLMNITRFKGKNFSEQMAVIKGINTAFQPDIIIMENNVFQQIFVQESDKMGLPVRGHTTGSNKYDLKLGVPGLALLYERGKIRCPRGNQASRDTADMLSNELMSTTFTENGIEGVGEHDDMMMSMWLNTIGVRQITTGFSFKFL